MRRRTLPNTASKGESSGVCDHEQLVREHSQPRSGVAADPARTSGALTIHDLRALHPRRHHRRHDLDHRAASPSAAPSRDRPRHHPVGGAARHHRRAALPRAHAPRRLLRPGRRTSGRSLCDLGGRHRHLRRAASAAPSAPTSAAAAPASGSGPSPTPSRPACCSPRPSAASATTSTTSCSACRPTCRGASRSSPQPGLSRSACPTARCSTRPSSTRSSGTSSASPCILLLERKLQPAVGQGRSALPHLVRPRPQLSRVDPHRPERDLPRHPRQRLGRARRRSCSASSSSSCRPAATPARAERRTVPGREWIRPMLR